MATEVYQIFYNAETRRTLDAGFLPLDNSRSQRPDWLEFWVIFNFLQTRELEEDGWYGFVSPKFGRKTGWDSRFVHDTVSRHGGNADVLLFSPFVDELATYQNTFEQAERWHPGIFSILRTAIDKLGVRYDPATAVDTLDRSVFCNYVVAKPTYWRRWRELALRLFEFSEHDEWGAGAMNASTAHNKADLPMKLFIQERLPSIILAEGGFRTHVPRENLAFSRHRNEKRNFLMSCEYLKQIHLESGDPYYLREFHALRRAYYGHGFHLG